MKQIQTILKAAEIVEPGCAITQAELVAYLNEYAEESKERPRQRMLELDKAALKVIARDAL